MKKYLCIISSFFLLSITLAANAQNTVALSYEYMDVSGERAYKASHNRNDSDTNSRYVPRISWYGKYLEHLELGASYAHITNLQTDGVSGNSGIFNEGGVVLPVVTPYKITEDIHDFTVFGGFNLNVNPRISISLGPELHYFKSKATFKDSKKTIRKFKSNDWRMGFYSRLTYDLGKNWIIQSNYRFAKLPKRKAHFLGIGVGVKF